MIVEEWNYVIDSLLLVVLFVEKKPEKKLNLT